MQCARVVVLTQQLWGNWPRCRPYGMLRRFLPPHPEPPCKTAASCRRPREGAGWAEADELEWGKPGWMQSVARLADQGVDLVSCAARLAAGACPCWLPARRLEIAGQGRWQARQLLQIAPTHPLNVLHSHYAGGGCRLLVSMYGGALGWEARRPLLLLLSAAASTDLPCTFNCCRAPCWHDVHRLTPTALTTTCSYIDQDGKSPSTPAFVETCAGLCGPSTRCLVSFERRAPEASLQALELLATERFWLAHVCCCLGAWAAVVR